MGMKQHQLNFLCAPDLRELVLRNNKVKCPKFLSQKFLDKFGRMVRVML